MNTTEDNTTNSNSTADTTHNNEQHFQRVITGVYPLEQLPSPKRLPSYQANSRVEAFEGCPECLKASIAAGRTNVYCPDHAFYYFHVLHHKPIDWQAVEKQEGKAFVERWKRHLG